MNEWCSSKTWAWSLWCISCGWPGSSHLITHSSHLYSGLPIRKHLHVQYLTFTRPLTREGRAPLPLLPFLQGIQSFIVCIQWQHPSVLECLPSSSRTGLGRLLQASAEPGTQYPLLEITILKCNNPALRFLSCGKRAIVFSPPEHPFPSGHSITVWWLNW